MHGVDWHDPNCWSHPSSPAHDAQCRAHLPVAAAPPKGWIVALSTPHDATSMPSFHQLLHGLMACEMMRQRIDHASVHGMPVQCEIHALHAPVHWGGGKMQQILTHVHDEPWGLVLSEDCAHDSGEWKQRHAFHWDAVMRACFEFEHCCWHCQEVNADVERQQNVAVVWIHDRHCHVGMAVVMPPGMTSHCVVL